jgi:tRNA threonylcarbamoyladenosine biosynthesis protein TsaE
LVKALARSYGIPVTSSPTFAIHHRYENLSTGFGFDHVDLYRLESDDDLESTGFWDLFAPPKGLVVIEWSDRLAVDLLPLNWSQVKVVAAKPADPAQRLVKVFAS